MLQLSQRILDAFDDLTKSERRLAEMLLQNPNVLLVHSASDLSEKAGISKATTTRFFRRLGYPSSKSAQKEAREGAATPSPDESLITKFNVGKADLGHHLNCEIQNLVRSVEQIRSDQLAQAIQSIARAEKLWVVGFGDNYALAHFARALLIRVKPDIRMIPIGGFSVPEEFASIQASDAVIALGIGRKTRTFRSIVRSARKAGAHVVLITDQATPAAADIANATLRCRTQGAGVFDSVVAAVSLLTYVCSSLALKIGQPAIDRLEFIDQIHEEWDDILVEDL